VNVAGADDLAARIDERQRLEPGGLLHGVGQKSVAALAPSGHEAMRAGSHLQERPDRDDGLVLRGHALAREHQRLFRGGLDLVGPIRLDLAHTVDEQRQDGNGGKHHQARSDAEHKPASSGLAVRAALIQHGFLPDLAKLFSYRFGLRSLWTDLRNTAVYRRRDAAYGCASRAISQESHAKSVAAHKKPVRNLLTALRGRPAG